jgi:hypothetical protein
MMTLRLPFNGETISDYEKALMKNEIRIDEIVGKGVYDDELIKIIHSMLNKVLLVFS